MINKSAIFLLLTAASAACSSSPAPTGQHQDVGSSGAPGGGAPAAGAGGAVVPSAGAGGALVGIGGASGGDTGLGGSAGLAGASGGSGGALTAGSGGTSGGAGGTVSAGGAGGAIDTSNLPNMIPAGYTGTPFGTAPLQIPGKIQIEAFDKGGSGVTFKASGTNKGNFAGCNNFARPEAVALQCTGQAGPQDLNIADCTNEPAGSVYLGYIGTGDYYKYTVDVLEAGTYVISGHEGVAANTQMSFAFTDAEKTGPVTLPSTAGCGGHEAYHNWGLQDNLGTIALTPGHYVLTITVVAAAMNLDWFAFTKM